MLPKSPECAGCPLFGDGRGFVPDVLMPGARVLILAQAPGADEEAGRRIIGMEAGRPVYEPCPPQPLVGRTGWALRGYLGQAGLKPAAVSKCNVLKCRAEIVGPKGKKIKVNDLPKGKMLKAAVAHCTTAYLRIPPETELVVASGAVAWGAMGGPGSITDWRGFLLEKGEP